MVMNMISVEVNGFPVNLAPGSTVLQACEKVGFEVPRFCYESRLLIAGNCRMCLVEIAGSPKPQASCALPISPNMKIFTESPLVKKAREMVMEFLLINHPLDCPICDQAGECDRQDQSMVYGSDRTRFFEMKRSVQDKYLGPIVATVMNRCIHCTRCIRFSSEIAGVAIMGTSGRGTQTEVGTYVDKLMSSELSGNLVDLCPVGALTSLPVAFTYRPWEETRVVDTIDTTDAGLGSIRVKSIGGRVSRVLPADLDEYTRGFISDKTRYSLESIGSDGNANYNNNGVEFTEEYDSNPYRMGNLINLGSGKMDKSRVVSGIIAGSNGYAKSYSYYDLHRVFEYLSTSVSNLRSLSVLVSGSVSFDLMSKFAAIGKAFPKFNYNVSALGSGVPVSNFGGVVGTGRPVLDTMSVKSVAGEFNIPVVNGVSNAVVKVGGNEFAKASELHKVNVSELVRSDNGMILLVGIDTRHEAAMRNARIRNSFLQSDRPIYLVGDEVNLTFPVVHLGNNLSIVRSILDGKHALSSRFFSSVKPVMIIGSGMFNREDGHKLYELVRSVGDVVTGGRIAGIDSGIDAIGSDIQVINLAHRSVGSLASSVLGIKSFNMVNAVDFNNSVLNNSEFVNNGGDNNIKDMFVTVGVDEGELKENGYSVAAINKASQVEGKSNSTSLKVSFSTHIDQVVKGFADITLPMATSLETNSHYMRWDGALVRANMAANVLGPMGMDSSLNMFMSAIMGDEWFFSSAEGDSAFTGYVVDPNTKFNYMNEGYVNTVPNGYDTHYDAFKVFNDVKGSYTDSNCVNGAGLVWGSVMSRPVRNSVLNYYVEGNSYSHNSVTMKECEQAFGPFGFADEKYLSVSQLSNAYPLVSDNVGKVVVSSKANVDAVSFDFDDRNYLAGVDYDNWKMSLLTDELSQEVDGLFDSLSLAFDKFSNKPSSTSSARI